MGPISRTEEMGAKTRGQTFHYDPEDLVLVDDPSSPLYDPSVNDPVPQDFVDGVEEHGVIEPVIVRKNGRNRKGVAIMEVVDGRTRVKAARIVNKKRKVAGLPPMLVEAKIPKGMVDAIAETAMIVCNEHRRTENLVTRSEKLRKFLAHGHTEKEAKRAFGVKSRGLKVLMEVLEMGDAIKAALKDKRITLEIARTLSALPEHKQKASLDSLLPKEGKAKGAEAKKSAIESVRSNGGPVKECVRCRTPKTLLKALKTLDCMPRDALREGRMEALEWVLGEREVAWAGNKK